MRGRAVQTIEEYLSETGKEIGVICSIDSNGNEYNHRFYTCDDGKADQTAWDLEIMKMEDLEIMKMEEVALWQADIKEARELGLKTIQDFYNY
jgi:hypothetical protein